MQHPRSTIRPQWPSRTAGDARAAPLEDDLAIASEDVQIDQTFGVCLYPSQLLTFEMLRRPIEFTQFTSKDWTDRLKAAEIEISMDGKGCWVDNVFVERLWHLDPCSITMVAMSDNINDN